MMKTNVTLFLTFAVFATATYATELHVATTGNDSNGGTKKSPFRTIQRAADLAQPGDVVTVHAGVYRERVSPPRGGESDVKRIIYRAAADRKTVVTGSEIMKGWSKVRDDVWKVTIPNSFFGEFNPYSDLIHGDWFGANGRKHHTGAVYLNGDWLIEAAQLDDLLKPGGNAKPSGEYPLWFGQVDKDNTTIWAQLKGVNLNEASVEINVRQTVFTPVKTGVNFITVRGFDLRNAAPPWAPPTAAQIGIVSAYWCKGWIIENNEISYSKCCGVALGKYGDEWDNRAESAEGYVGTLTRGLSNGWNKATVGSHIVRNNHIHHCDQTGVVGSLGCSFSTITGNVIHDIHTHRRFGGAEMAGIKFHGAIDVTISHNHIYRCGDVSGIWLDWMGQGARVTGNLMHDNTGAFGDIFCEMQHGPILIDNNLFLSPNKSFSLNSQGIAFVHNLITGPIANHRGDTRVTPFHKAHSTELAGMYPAAQGDSGDHRFYNNLVVAPSKLQSLDNSALPCFAAGNVFAKGTQASKFDSDALLKLDFDPGIKLAQKTDGWYLTITEDKACREEAKHSLVTTGLLGKAKVPDLLYENTDGTPLCIATDYFGKRRDLKNPMPGPFEHPGRGEQSFKVW